MRIPSTRRITLTLRHLINDSPAIFLKSLPPRALPPWQFSFRGEVICVAIRCYIVALRACPRYTKVKEDAGNEGSSARPDEWV